MSLVKLIRFESAEFEREQDNLRLITLREEEYQRGYQDGMAEMEMKYQAETEMKAREIIDNINQLSSQVRSIAAQIEGQAGDLAAAAVSGVLPELARRGLAEEMALAVRDLVGRLEPPHLRISGPEKLLEAIKLHLDQTGPDKSLLPITFEADEAAVQGHATLEWPSGRAEFSHGDMLEQVTASLNSLMAEKPSEMTNNLPEGVPS